MTAIITDKIKRTFLSQLFDEATGTKLGDSNNNYYIAVGRSQQWDPVANTDVAPTPNVTDRETRLFRYNLQSVKAIEAFSHVVPIKDWTTNTQYAQYNDNSTGHPSTSYYVKTAENNVYVCLRVGKDSLGNNQVSTVKPDHTNTSLPIEADGYIWKFMYSISTADTNFFTTSNFMPVKKVDSASATDPGFAQFTIQNAAVSGQILGYRVTNGGSGYDSATTTLTVVGDGNGAKAYAVVGSGVITAVEVGESSGTTDISSFLGSGYKQANVRITSPGGTNATVVPVFAHDSNGLGANPINDLRASAMMFHIKPEGNVSGNWIVDNDYRQIALWKNPLVDSASRNKFQGTAGNCLKKIRVTSPISSSFAFANDVEITGDSNAKAWVDFIQDSTIWYHQDEASGFTPFRSGETITVEGLGSTRTIATGQHNIRPDVDRYSGEIFFINNASAQTRTTASTDDIKLVVQL